MVEVAFPDYQVCLSNEMRFNNKTISFLGENGVKGRFEKSSYFVLMILYRLSGYGWTTWS